MATVTNTIESKVLELAREQMAALQLLLPTKLLADNAELQQHLQTSAMAVVSSLEEGLNPSRKQDFQKNFLVIAKSYNVEYGSLLRRSLDEERISIDKYNDLTQKNKLVQDNIVSQIEQRQHLYGYKQ